ncbi:MAG: hypothetical protein CFE21_12625 [Bacteroidetes bacterium B1(2017)]|nr:MAG: hypothetical protein CFE21_12625 [Bacteroidetes bacterium B1(2017)]
MRSIFVDANVVIDWLNSDSVQNKTCTKCIELMYTLYEKPMVSPVSIAIVFYIVGKKVKNKKLLRSTLMDAFSNFRITGENAQTLRQVFASHYLDLEDGIQYFSALEAKADAIVTFNGFDYPHSQIPILHPEEFLQLHGIE